MPASRTRVRQPLSGFPAVEGVGIVRHQVREFGVGLFEFEQHRRGEIAQQRGDRRGGNAFEDEGLRGLSERQHARGVDGFRLAGELKRRIAAVGQDERRVRRGYAARLRRQAAPIRLSAFRRRGASVA